MHGEATEDLGEGRNDIYEMVYRYRQSDSVKERLLRCVGVNVP